MEAKLTSSGGEYVSFDIFRVLQSDFYGSSMQDLWILEPVNQTSREWDYMVKTVQKTGIYKKEKMGLSHNQEELWYLNMA